MQGVHVVLGCSIKTSADYTVWGGPLKRSLAVKQQLLKELRPSQHYEVKTKVTFTLLHSNRTRTAQSGRVIYQALKLSRVILILLMPCARRNKYPT